MTKITPLNDHGNIELKFTVDGKVYRFAPVKRGKFSNPSDRAKAIIVARGIERDIEARDFDVTLERYKPQRVKVQSLPPKEKPVPKLTDDASLISIYQRWYAYKSATVASNSTIALATLGRKLEQCPHTKVSESRQILQWLINDHKGVSTLYVKGQWQTLVQCLHWAVASGLCASNPFPPLKPMLPTTSKKRIRQAVTITNEERDAIIRTVYESERFRDYALLVKLLFVTGCRPGEAIGLCKRDIKGCKLTFSRTIALNGTVEQGLKTQPTRTITIPQSLADELHNALPMDKYPHDYLFTNSKGKLINWNNFIQGVWRPLLVEAGVEYKKPYQMRHTAITNMIKAGIDSTIVAAWVGNSPTIISKHYLGNVSDIPLPE